MKKRKELSWKPRLGLGQKGVQTYCAPACGRGCTFQEYIDATNAARKLSVRLGAGWKPVVWENMGWFYSVRRGPLTVYASKFGKQIYTCLMSEMPSGTGGSTLWLDQKHYRTPEAAVQAQLRLARDVLKRLTKTIYAAERKA